MNKKISAAICVLSLLILFFSGCEEQKIENPAAGKIYTYSGKTFSGLDKDLFTIKINEDGTYLYYESLLSSTIGAGKWSLQDDVLTLSSDTGEGPSIVNRFLVAGDDLIFIEDGSSNFELTKVKDGERFYGSPESAGGNENSDYAALP